MAQNKRHSKPAFDTETFYREVVSLAETPESWVLLADRSGRISPTQVLVVILWVLPEWIGREATESEKMKVVADWCAALLDATVMRGGRYLDPLNELTNLEISDRMLSPYGWRLILEQVDVWFHCLGKHAAFCADYVATMAQHIQTPKSSTGVLTVEDVKAFRKANKRALWTREHRHVLFEFQGTQAELAKLLGISKSVVGDQLRLYDKKKIERVANGTPSVFHLLSDSVSRAA